MIAGTVIALVLAGGSVKLESIPGTDVKRVILSARALERLGIEISAVDEQPIVRRQMLGGLVVPPLSASGGEAAAKPATAGFATFTLRTALKAARRVAAVPASTAPPQAAPATAAPVDGSPWVAVTLSQGEWDRLAKDKPARIAALSTRERSFPALQALPAGLPPVEDPKRSMLTIHYVVAGKDHGLTLNQRVRVEVQQAGSDEKHKVVPYGAVYYDAKGAAWVYVSTGPATFERRRIAVDRVAGDLAILGDGPPVGTSVVVVGAPLLYGAEIFGK